MKQIIKKMYLSIFTSILVLVVSVTTTYAWAGILSYSSTEQFNVGLDYHEQSDYSILISTDGIHFGDSLDIVEVKRSILTNMGIDCSSYTNDFIHDLFKQFQFNPISMQRRNQLIGPFVSLDDILKSDFNYTKIMVDTEKAKKSYFNFDIYITFDYAGAEENITEEILNESQVVYLANIQNLVSSNNRIAQLANPFTFTNYFNGKEFVQATVTAADAMRVAITKYELMDRSMPDDTKNPVKSYIYQGGTALPSETQGVQSFGGIMEEKNNIAFYEYNVAHQDKTITEALLNEFKQSRSDASGKEDAIAIKEVPYLGNWLVDVDEGLCSKKMIKFNVKVWLEGFDGDCFEIISKLPVSLNLIFATKKKVEEVSNS